MVRDSVHAITLFRIKNFVVILHILQYSQASTKEALELCASNNNSCIVVRHSTDGLWAREKESVRNINPMKAVNFIYVYMKCFLYPRRNSLAISILIDSHSKCFWPGKFGKRGNETIYFRMFLTRKK
jgi:hypothetical protein